MNTEKTVKTEKDPNIVELSSSNKKKMAVLNKKGMELAQIKSQWGDAMAKAERLKMQILPMDEQFDMYKKAIETELLEEYPGGFETLTDNPDYIRLLHQYPEDKKPKEELVKV